MISYINEKETELLYKEFYTNGYSKKRKKINIEGSVLNFLKTAWSNEVEEENGIFDQLISVTDHLINNNLISYSRPKSIIEAELTNDYIYENVLASKLYFPNTTLKDFPNITEIIVWVTDPQEYEFRGTFLYLIQPLYDKGYFYSNLSGCSALQALSNIVLEKPLFEINEHEPLGRGSYKHPTKKLKELGAVNLGKFEIKTLYRKRYITNEQCFTYERKRYRCNDLLGYPLLVV